MIEKVVKLRNRGKYYRCELSAVDEESAETLHRALQTAFDFSLGVDGPDIPRSIKLVDEAVFEKADEDGAYGYFIWRKEKVSQDRGHFLTEYTSVSNPEELNTLITASRIPLK